jgi:hypothetical protein
MEREIHCNYNMNYCKFMRSCDSGNFIQWFLEFEMFDDLISNSYGLPSNNNFMIPGTVFGDTSDTCYLPVFRSVGGSQDTWYIGNLFLQYFYLVFDMTPYDEHSLNYI